MPIPEEQLQRWASAPSKTEMQKIKRTKEIVEQALKDHLDIDEIKRQHSLSAFDYDVYLQGSYANSTNIRFDSDVDIVVQLNSVFGSDKSQLTEGEIKLHETHYSDSKYKFLQYKQDLFDAMVKSFGSAVEYANKCIKIAGNGTLVDADIVPCFQFRVYKRFLSYTNHEYVEGMKFWNTEDNSIIYNFPKVHLANCTSKNQDTDKMFKSMIRLFKNIKSGLVESKIIDGNVAPSYFVENLLYNCSSPCFDGNYSDNSIKTLQFLFDALEKGRLTGFVCANEQDSLISDKTWNMIDAQKFILEAANYYLKKT